MGLGRQATRWTDQNDPTRELHIVPLAGFPTARRAQSIGGSTMKVVAVRNLPLAWLLAFSVPSMAVVVDASPSFAADSAMKSLDPDKDGTIDLAEAKTAASAFFDSLEKDKDNTLDRKELNGRIPDADWAAADPDNDKTITKDEYLAYVEAVFKKADSNHDGTVSAQELKAPAGQALLHLLK
jgi:hypothetical protein